MTESTSQQLKVSTVLGYFGAGRDRYCGEGYHPDMDIRERIAQVATVEGLDGVELHYPQMILPENLAELKALLEDKGLACSLVSVSLWSEMRWGRGSLTHPDPAVCKEAIERVKIGMGLARKIGAGRINLWLGQDGFEYPFQIDYRAALGQLIEALQICAEAEPEVKICLEYKPRDPRAHLVVDNVGKVLWLADRVSRPNLGVLLDIGHAFEAYENPAQSAILLHQEGRLFHVHLNDTYGEVDWDMLPGTLRFWETLELLFWLQTLGYEGWCSLDIVMPRGDPLRACAQGVKNVRNMWKLASRLDREQVLSNLLNREHPDNLSLVYDSIFAALGT